MAANYGVNFSIENGAASPIAIKSDTVIGIAACIRGLKKEHICDKANAILAFSNVSKAKDFVSALIKKYSLEDFRLLDTLECIHLQRVSNVIIISFFEELFSISAGDEEGLSEDFFKQDTCSEAIEVFRQARNETGFAPDLIIAPYYSHEAGIKAKLQSVAQAMNITAIVDLYASNTGEAIKIMNTFSSKRVVATWPWVQILNTQGRYSYVPQSPIIAGMIAHTDGDREYGFSNSYSNRVMNGVSGVEHFIDFIMGEDCDADRLRKNHISTCILYEGYRSWGGETSDEDSIWQDLARVRTFDRIAQAAQKASFKAIDKKASELYFVKISVEEMLRNLKGAKVLIGYEVEWDEEQNTPSNVSAGKFYLKIKTMNNPIVKQLTINFKYSHKWSDDLIKTMQGG